MNFFQSIRWRLQLWYGVLLAILLGSFGFTTYRLESARQTQRIDEELQQRLPILVASQRPAPGDQGRREFKLSRKYEHLFDQEENGEFYYVVWLRHGTPVTRSTTAAPDVPQPNPGDPPNRSRGDLRESFLFPGPGDCVLVGRRIANDLTSLRQFAWWLGGVGAAVLVLGLAGGAWLVNRALRPIRSISSAAEKIANGDLTERIESEENASELGQLAAVLNSTFARLDASFARQARFTADAAHELRTPLSVILTHVQNGLTSDHLTDDQKEAFEACQRAAQRMRRLTESLLTLSRTDTPATPENRQLCDLGKIVRDAATLLRPLADEHRVTVLAETQACPCKADPGQLEQVAVNLIGNAIFHNHPGGHVKVTSSSGKDDLTLTVSDTGPGIPPEHLPHIFERFYRVDPARSGGRSGLGLSITRAIVEAHGGSIQATSTPGEGSTFTVRLPLPLEDRS